MPNWVREFVAAKTVLAAQPQNVDVQADQAAALQKTENAAAVLTASAHVMQVNAAVAQTTANATRLNLVVAAVAERMPQQKPLTKTHCLPLTQTQIQALVQIPRLMPASSNVEASDLIEITIEITLCNLKQTLKMLPLHIYSWLYDIAALDRRKQKFCGQSNIFNNTINRF